MFAKRMGLDMEDYMTTGRFLTVEERMILSASLPGLQLENRFSTVALHGKILGTDGDYYIACGREKDFIRNKKFFYSLDAQSWRVLFPPTPEELSEFRFLRSRFTGDPTHDHHFYQADKKVSMREESRLRAAVHLMDWETCVGPKGALQIDHRTGLVRENPHYAGLDDPENLASYVHQRLPTGQDSFVATRRLCLAAGDASLDFLEPIAEDYPPGCWVLRSDPSSGVVRLRSLWWPGYNFCYKTSRETRGTFGALYMGLGDRNDDLPFMI